MKYFFCRLSSLIGKEYRQLIRDRSSFIIGIFIPIMLIILIGYGMSLDVKNVPVAVVMEDASPLAQDVLSFVDGSDYFAPRYTTSMKEGTEMMDRREVDAVIRVPPNFTESLFPGRRPCAAHSLGVWARLPHDRQKLILKRVSPHGRPPMRQSTWQRQTVSAPCPLYRGSGSMMRIRVHGFIPGLIVIIMTFVGVFLTTMVMAREWERGTLESLFITPVRPLEILLSKMIPYFCVASVGFWLCIAAARYLYGVPVHGSFLMILFRIGDLPYRDVGHGSYDFIGSQNQFLACQISMLVSMLPTMMLSGFILIFAALFHRICRGACPSRYLLYGTFEIALSCGK